MSSAFASTAAFASKRQSGFGPAFRTRERQRESGGFGYSLRSGGAKAEPLVVAASYTDFPSLKKTGVAAAPSKPVMNFKAVAAAAASKPAPIPACLSAAKPTTATATYYRDEWDDDEEVELEITDEDGGLNSRRAGDKSNW
jgi:hypothetical protein